MSILLRTLCAVLLAGAVCAPAPATPSVPAFPAALTAATGNAASELGVVIDFRRVGVRGVTVLAVTPGGTGERLGLRPGDRIVAANGFSLTETRQPSAALASALSEKGSPVRLDVLRDGRSLTLQGSAAPTTTAAPAPRGCGHLTAGGAHPRTGRDIFPVLVIGIDGENVLPQQSSRHRVETGRRVVVVRERVDASRFSQFALDERERQKARHGMRLDKVMIVDVAPDTTYAIGAKAIRPIPTGAVRDNSFWEPVVWRTSAEPCP